jgi:hypothetical protein
MNDLHDFLAEDSSRTIDDFLRSLSAVEVMQQVFPKAFLLHTLKVLSNVLFLFAAKATNPSEWFVGRVTYYPHQQNPQKEVHNRVEAPIFLLGG